MSDDVFFSRSVTGLATDGKATEDLKIHVSAELKEQLTGLAVLHGLTLSEYVRRELQRHVYGEVHVLRIGAGLVQRRDA